MELSQTNIVGPPSPLSPGGWYMALLVVDLPDKSIDLGKTIAHGVAREVEGRLLSIVRLVRLDDSMSVCQTSTRHLRREHTNRGREHSYHRPIYRDGEQTCRNLQI